MSDQMSIDSVSSASTLVTSEPSSEVIVRSGGDMSVGDDMIAMSEAMEDKRAVKKAEKEFAKAAGIEKPKEQKEPKEDKKELGEKYDEEKDQDKAQDKDTAKLTQKEPKVLKLEVDGKTVDIREDAIVSVPVNGKIEKHTLKELKAQFSGKVDYTRKYQEFHNERTQHNTERQTLQNHINEIHRLAVEEKNPRLAIDFLAEMMGADPKEIWNTFKTPLVDNVKALRELSDEDLAKKEIEDELDYYRKKEDFRRSTETKAREEREILTKVETVRDQYNLTPESFKQHYNELYEEAQRTGFDVSKLTPEMVGQYYDVVSKKSSINEFVTESFPGEKQSSIAQSLRDTWDKNPDLSIDDIKDIARQVYGTKSRSSLAKKVMAEKQEPTRPQTEVFGWDEIE